MIDGLKPYSKYKNSGVLWLGDVPEHWKVLPGRTLFREVNDRDHPNEELLSVTISRGVVRQADLLSDSSKKDSSNEDKSAYKLVEPGDIAYNKMRAWQGAVGVSAYRGIVSPAYIVQRLRNPRYSPRYIHYLLRTPSFTTEAERWSYGITSDQWSLRAEDFKNIYFSVPGPDEQTAIVRFLDWVERRIRRVIRARRQRIKLLEEYKQALINQAVTGKIDVRTGKPYPKYKNSGVEWLGEVPKHWEVFPNRAMFDEIKDRDCSDEQMLSVTIKKGVIRQADLLEDSWKKDQSNLDRSKYKLVQLGDIAYNKMRAWQGAFGASSYRGIVSPAYIVQRPRSGCNSLYFHYLFRSPVFAKEAERWSYGIDSDMWSLRPEHFRLIYACRPPLHEQAAIVEFLDEQIERIDVAITVDRRAIELLKEFRTRLIADVVTGKLDVRKVAAKLPDEPPEDDAEPLDEEETAKDNKVADETDLEAVSEEAET